MDDEESTDTFPVQYSFCLSLFINYSFSVMEVLWSFSILLEAVAILPQLHMLKHTGQAEALTRYYIVCLGTYHALYILNWIYLCVYHYICMISALTRLPFRWRYTGNLEPIAGVCGIFQTCLNFYFIYVYWKKYPREIDIESDPYAPRPPMLVVDKPSEDAPNLETPVDLVASGVVEQA
jgi:ER lumen protein retaining receptor